MGPLRHNAAATGNGRADRLARKKQPSQVACVKNDLMCYEKLETLPAGTKPKGHDTVDRLAGGERLAQKKAACRRSSCALTGRDRAMVNLTNIGTVSCGGTAGRRGERIRAFPSA